MTERRCIACGAPMPENKNVCEYCGMSYEREPEEGEEEIVFYADNVEIMRIRKGER